ncbi:MAG: type II secretion system protein [Candidatus Roizmanbacteria bacterium]|nr:type II secretion system protein [Candidatus Roizmanbacteria bacterium]
MKKSFTLLEMLIVLGIIALLLSVLTVSFSTAQKKSRDAKRKGDIKALQNGLEQYYATCNFAYPTGTLAVGTPLACGASTPVISVMPVDPKSGSGYTYTPTGSSEFSICTTNLEAETATSFCLYNQQ